MRESLPRYLAALPDAITAALFVAAWTTPALLGPRYVANLMLVMLIEFIVMHSSGFYAGLAASDASRLKRLAALCALTAFYATFIAAFALVFASAWPLLAFGWLFVSRFAHIWTHPVESGAETQRAMLQWVASAVTYVLGAILTVMLPLPHFGITAEFIASMHLTGSGEWIERPYTVLAFGALYFAMQAWVKYASTPAARPARAVAVAPATAAKRSLGNLMGRGFSAALGGGDDKRSP